jgi:hypothetical protein
MNACADSFRLFVEPAAVSDGAVKGILRITTRIPLGATHNPT